MIERHHLEILRGIEQYGSLTAAAEQLHLTQSALSHAMKKLEQQAGVALWLKRGRKLRLTQAGNYLLNVANRVIPQLQDADGRLRRFAKGEAGALRIGMECHPCYRWLLTVVEPYLQQWPEVDVDVKNQFQFGGMAALFNYAIDVLVTPDPLLTKGVSFTPAFDYELVLVVSDENELATKAMVLPVDLQQQVLFTYPVAKERLDIFADFLLPANSLPKQHKTVEATEMMLQMVAANRGVSVLPRWLLEQYQTTENMRLKAVQLGSQGIHKTIFLGTRDHDNNDPQPEYLSAFLSLACAASN